MAMAGRSLAEVGEDATQRNRTTAVSNALIDGNRTTPVWYHAAR